MSKYFFFTQCLKPAQTKKICASLMQQDSWRDVMSGSTGVVIDETTVNFKDLTKVELSTIQIPQAASFNLAAFCQVTPDNTCYVRLPLGGNSSIPEGLGSRNSSIRISTGTFQGVDLTSEYDSSYWHQSLLSQQYSELNNLAHVHEINIKVKLTSNLPSGEVLFSTHTAQYEKELNQLAAILKLLNLPAVPHDAFIECIGIDKNCDSNLFPTGTIRCALRYNAGKLDDVSKPPNIRYTFVYDSLALPQWQNMNTLLQEWLIEENATFRIGSYINYGRMNWFSGYPQCVTVEAQDLLRRECSNPMYDFYDLSYMKLEPETWEIREKRRKKLREPRFMQLGKCILENGCEITLRLKMLKEGYVIYLDFPSEDDMIKFSETQVYRMTKWENSAE